MEEDQANWLREQVARRRASEEGSEEGEAAARENQEPWTWASPVGWDQPGPWSRELPALESLEAAGPGGEQEAVEAGPSRTEGGSQEEPGGREPGGPGGGEMAAPEVEFGRRREKQGASLEEDSKRGGQEGGRRRYSWKRGDQHPGTFRERYWERSQERYREKSAKLKLKSKIEKKYRLEKKPNWLNFPRLGEAEDNEVNKEDFFIPTPGRRPTIRFSLQPRTRQLSQLSAFCVPSNSVINELAKMGDPDVLEMVQEEGESWRSGASGGWRSRAPRVDQATPGARTPGDVGGPAAGLPGTFAEWHALRETGSARRTVPAWVGG